MKQYYPLDYMLIGLTVVESHLQTFNGDINGTSSFGSDVAGENISGLYLNQLMKWYNHLQVKNF